MRVLQKIFAAEKINRAVGEIKLREAFRRGKLIGRAKREACASVSAQFSTWLMAVIFLPHTAPEIA
jgi:hypothetical protein